MTMLRALAPMLTACLMIAAGYWLAAPPARAQATVCPPDHVWHAPACGHEHGDAPPQWIADAGYQAGFDHEGGFHGNTTPAENTLKHRSMKGMHAVFPASGQEAYVRLHFASNVFERMSRYHSAEVFLRDVQGGVSHWQGWTNTGNPDPKAPQTGRVSKAAPDPGYRPVVLVTDQAALEKGLKCEQWYSSTSSWGPEFGWTICDSTSFYFPEEAQYTDYQFPLCGITAVPPICLGSNRELEFSWYLTGSPFAASRGNLAPKDVEFYATQFGEGVSGPDDPKCQVGAMTTRFGGAYQNVCLSQYVASTARAVENLPSVPNANRYRKDYDVTGVTYPN